MSIRQKITNLWLLTICGFACHCLINILPILWGKDIAISCNGTVNYRMIVLIMTVTFLIPTTGILCCMCDEQKKTASIINAILAVLVAFFNIAHAFMELPSENCGQCVVMPLMVLIGGCLAWYSVSYARNAANE